MKKQLLLFIFIPFLSFSQVQIGQDIDGEAVDDESGFSVSLSSDGSIVAIGGIYNSGNGLASGHVRVFNNQSGVWTQIGSDIDGEDEFDFFGFDVSLSSNGSIVAISGNGNDGNGNDSGHVRVYENQSGTWTQIGQDIDGEAAGDLFGSSVSLSSDGSIIAIGASSNSGIGSFSGHVQVYENQSGSWIQIGSDIDGQLAGDQSGYKVSLSADGSIVAISAIRNDGVNGIDSGHVRVFENQSGIWTQIGQDIDGEAGDDFFGRSLSLSDSGDIVAIGAHQNDGVNGNDSGHVQVYENQSGVWTQIGSDIDGEVAGDSSGYSLSLSANGSILAIGAVFNAGNGSNSGHVRIYENQSGVWTQIGLDIDGEAAGDLSGGSLSLSSDGSIVAIGAQGNNENGSLSGHVRLYDLSALLSLDEFVVSNFKLYPNPTKTQFTIQLENPSELENVNIYNNLGQLIFMTKETIVDTSQLSAGIYMIEVETIRGKGSKKLIIE